MKRLIRIVAWCAVCLLALVIAASFHPTVRSVYRAFRPSTAYDVQPPTLPELADPAVLVFSKTNGFRHVEGIAAGLDALRAISERRGWSLFHTENGAVFDAGLLARFRVVVWLCASGAPLDAPQRLALRNWIEGGGGYVGVHAAMDGSHVSWEWYVRDVVGAGFIGHPLAHQTAAVRVERPDHPAVRGAAASWEHLDEWYSFDRSVRGDPGVEVLASVDEATYDQQLRLLWVDRSLSMGDHPIIWTRQPGSGRVLLSALGHRASAYRDPNHLAILESGIEWAGNLAEPVLE